MPQNCAKRIQYINIFLLLLSMFPKKVLSLLMSSDNSLKMRIMNILKALAWLLLLVLFTYTPIIAAMFMNNGSVVDSYYESQHMAISLFVNLGLLGMVLIDYFSVYPTIDWRVALVLSIGVFATFVIYVHCGIIYHGKGYLYKYIINNIWLSPISHCVLLAVIWNIKYRSLSKPVSYIIATKV